jgi:hypothetical protein
MIERLTVEKSAFQQFDAMTSAVDDSDLIIYCMWIKGGVPRRRVAGASETPPERIAAA